jgi:hypothetical protein
LPVTSSRADSPHGRHRTDCSSWNDHKFGGGCRSSFPSHIRTSGCTGPCKLCRSLKTRSVPGPVRARLRA